jgi:hypothetical protein
LSFGLREPISHGVQRQRMSADAEMTRVDLDVLGLPVRMLDAAAV